MTERFSSTALGFVCIVGAGPGPLDRMTLRALNRLRNATVVINTRLDSTEVLGQIPPQARRVYVGKALGDRVVPQHGFHALLLAHARIDSRMVRLKGGVVLMCLAAAGKRYRPCWLKALLLRWCRV